MEAETVAVDPLYARPKPSEAMLLMYNLRTASQAHHGVCERTTGPNCGVSLLLLRRAAQIVSKETRPDEAAEVNRVLDTWLLGGI